MSKKAFTPVKCNQRLLFSKAKNFTGFTLIELLIVIGIIAILAAAVIIAINPGQQFAAARDSTRESHLNSLKNSILSYQVDNAGAINELDITTTPQEICKTGASDCTGLADLSGLSDYISEMPVDPSGGEDENGTGYYILKMDGEVAIKANKSETRNVRAGSWVFTDPRNDETYKAVLIGDQLWMAENMNYDNGCYTTSDTDWEDGTDSCRHNEKAGTEEEARETYGLLYQWSAAMDGSTTEGAQGICPDGWHLPTDEEWRTLEEELGMSASAADSTGWRGDDVGGKLKEEGTEYWESPNECGDATCNSSGFTALPGRHISTSGDSLSVGSDAHFWSSSESGDSAWRRSLNHGYSAVFRNSYDKAYGLSVRCVRD